MSEILVCDTCEFEMYESMCVVLMCRCLIKM